MRAPGFRSFAGGHASQRLVSTQPKDNIHVIVQFTGTTILHDDVAKVDAYDVGYRMCETVELLGGIVLPEFAARISHRT